MSIRFVHRRRGLVQLVLKFLVCLKKEGFYSFEVKSIWFLCRSLGFIQPALERIWFVYSRWCFVWVEFRSMWFGCKEERFCPVRILGYLGTHTHTHTHTLHSQTAFNPIDLFHIWWALINHQEMFIKKCIAIKE